ncbi:dynein regulatory complex subunit 7 [Numida meleagris]|uniref:dynein regulatory complex subunit 7 n=1 Tax=Numida meleagris TaxID=8996 RepID=UPI000B3DD13E|nr:dynein regulatory complex subunit 7 [Numida meleagris]XP_021263686.1 dynein regulatory complex subunit 7 [Numida meleagris]XP_021263687.1 dynein regulatory complex subunit 7 [Numida meleagris]XP_021263688.1 dynein regulatory complex subunit 7 [Numida meleagris]
MEVIEEKEEQEQKEEELKGLEPSSELHDVETKLSVEQVCFSSDVPDFDWNSIDTSQLPDSYKMNSPREKKLLRIADHYHQQYAHLCPERKPLFLHPVNECGVEKFVSTTLRPTLLPYTELYHWDGCASFVSDFLTMEPLKCPLTLPSCLYSPTTILKYQRGNCFDFSVLLCSMLIGAGYDAYCVSGYATHDICSLDETLEECPLLRKPQEVPKEEVKKSNKYRVKSLPDMHSKFELQQEAKKKAETEATLKKEREEMGTELEEPTRDRLCGLRVHAWVLVLSGKREVPETFFINPFTGNSHSTMDEQFLGIESVWNHENYWVNMQDCQNGCKDLVFDLSDSVHWEIMLSETAKPLQLLLSAEKENELFDRNMDDMEEEEEEEEEEIHFTMPPSWVAQIQLSPKEFETRCSQGRKVILYKKAKLEKWAPYLNGNGLVKRLTIYADLSCTEVVEVKEWFKNREDMLDMREVNKQTQLTTEYFSPGHLFGLKVHIYKSMSPQTERVMEFYHETRVDGLQKLAENANEMREYFVGRDDFKYFQHTEFRAKRKKVTLAGTTTDGRNSRPIVQIKECFHRNLQKPADEDVAERVFLIEEEVIQLTYHLKDKYITASKKDFLKPTEGYRKQSEIMTPEMCITYQAGSPEQHTKLVHLYKLLQELTEEEKRLKQQAWQSQAEVLKILEIRENEEADIQLSASIYDTERNEKKRQEYEAMMNAKRDEFPGQRDQDLDYLAPFLIQIGSPEKITKRQALRLRDDCLSDFKNRLVSKANIIQAHFEKEVEELQKKNQQFQENQNQLSKEEEAAFLADYSETMFRIHILALRLDREKQTAPQKYLALEEKLCKDPRLAEHLGHA